GTVERVTRGVGGVDYHGAANTFSGEIIDPRLGSLAISDDGGTVAFGAQDGNLFVGDGNGALDLQGARRAAPPGPGGPAHAAGPAAPRPAATTAVAAAAGSSADRLRASRPERRGDRGGARAGRRPPDRGRTRPQRAATGRGRRRQGVATARVDRHAPHPAAA